MTGLVVLFTHPQRVGSPKNENSVFNYSPFACFKRYEFIPSVQLKRGYFEESWKSVPIDFHSVCFFLIMEVDSYSFFLCLTAFRNS